MLRSEGLSVKGSPQRVGPLALMSREGPTHNSKITEINGPVASNAPSRNFSNFWRKRHYHQFLPTFLTWASMGKCYFRFLKCTGKTTIFAKNLLICNFSGYKEEPSDVETFLNILVFVVENSVWNILFFFTDVSYRKVQKSQHHSALLCTQKNDILLDFYQIL